MILFFLIMDLNRRSPREVEHMRIDELLLGGTGAPTAADAVSTARLVCRDWCAFTGDRRSDSNVLHLEETRLREFLYDADIVGTGLAFYFNAIQLHSRVQQGAHLPPPQFVFADTFFL
jgi:hypothetical protein